jgi:hypothetical protein
MLGACLGETLASCGRRRHQTDLCLQDEVLRWGGTHPGREPPQVGRAPMGPAHVTDRVAEHKGFETALGICESAAGLFTRLGARAHGFLCDLGDLDRGQSPRARQAGQWYRVSPVRVDAVTGFVGQEGGRHAPAGIVFLP